jgi:hypothetical protein
MFSCQLRQPARRFTSHERSQAELDRLCVGSRTCQTARFLQELLVNVQGSPHMANIDIIICIIQALTGPWCLPGSGHPRRGPIDWDGRHGLASSGLGFGVGIQLEHPLESLVCGGHLALGRLDPPQRQLDASHLSRRHMLLTGQRAVKQGVGFALVTGLRQPLSELY